MGFRFRKSVKVGGLRINFSKSGIGYSYGVKGLRYTKTAKGKDRVTASIPGTGLSWSTESGGKRKSQHAQTAARRPEQALAGKGAKYTMPLGPNLVIGAVSLGIGEYYYLSHGYEIGTAIISGLILGAIIYVVLYGVCGAILSSLGVGKTEEIQDVQSISTENTRAVSEEQEEHFEVQGVFYHKKEVEKVMESNPAWRKTCKALINSGIGDKRVYRFKKTIKPAQLVEEPDNPHDENAVMVQIEGEKVGYIASDEACHVKEIMKTKTIKEVTATITGGDYKIIIAEGQMMKNGSGPFIELVVRYQ